MPTQNELNISNKSYTNKDFNSIYAELLDLVSTLTNKWDPSHSNESDPGVVLIKLAALLADKNNYNIDKNILECFPLSASQEGNVRAFYDLLGYSMSWYKSASCKINIYNKSEYEITLEPFKYIFTDEKAKISYTLIGSEDIGDTLNIGGNSNITGLLIEGAIQEFKVGGSNLVKLNNLDDNLRLYFNEKNIAENGIFISNADIDGNFNITDVKNWVKVDNLASVESTLKCYKFGVLPNSNTCYIQFSPNINRDIQNGLVIKYVVSNGEAGRISSNVLTKIAGDINGVKDGESKIVNDYIRVTNPASSVGGYNPQNIKDAYDDYKRIINTFNTLVTEKDYENFIYNIRFNNDNPVVSNVVVADRTNNISGSNVVIKLFNDLSVNKYILNENMNAYNIAIYALEPPTILNNANDFNKTFTPVSRATEKNIIEYNIDDSKSIQHDFIDTHPEEISIDYCYINKYSLQGTVYTYNKISETEIKSIEDNIQSAIYNNFNARKMSFGQDVNYNDLVEVITKADPRIRLIALNQPEYSLELMKSDGLVGEELSVDKKEELLTRMILKGNVQALDFDNSFNWEFGQVSASVNSGIKSITTNFTPTISSTTLTLGPNQNVQIFRDNYIVDKSYGTYVKYTYKITQAIKSGDIYELEPGDNVNLNYTDSNGDSQSINLSIGTIIRLVNIDWDNTNTSGYFQGNEALEILKLNSYDVKPNTPCFWVTNDFTYGNNNITYTLFKEGSTEILDTLKLVHLDKEQNILNILQSGVKITRPSGLLALTYTIKNSPNISNVMDQGINATDVQWEYVKYTLTTVDQYIISLGEGCKITNSGTAITLGNDKEKIETPSNISYVDQDGVPTTLSNSPSSWHIRSRLNLNLSKDSPQTLNENESIVLNNDENLTIRNKKILSNIPLNIAGGIDINVQELNFNGEYESTLSIYEYNEAQSTASYEFERLDNGWIALDKNKLGLEKPFKLQFSTVTDYYYIIPIIFAQNGEEDIFNIDLDGNSTSTMWDNKISEPINSNLKLGKYETGVIYPYYLATNDKDITLTITVNKDNFQGNVYVGKIYKVSKDNDTPKFSPQVISTINNPHNKVEGTQSSSINKSKILEKLNANGFDWTYIPTPEDQIDTDNLDEDEKGNLFNPKSIWDPNHICNKFTIAQYNTAKSNINVSSISKKR